MQNSFREKCFIVKRLLGNHSSNLEQSQQENLFHTRCKVLDKTCSLVVDSGSVVVK